jgi:hypothetical protein
VTVGFGCSLLEDCPAWDWLVETAVPGGRLEDLGADVVGVPCDSGIGVSHRFISPIIVAAAQITGPTALPLPARRLPWGSPS